MFQPRLAVRGERGRSMHCERALAVRGGIESSMKNEFPLGMRVLAVDDDRVCLRMLETLLGRCGYRVTAVQHAMEALELLRGNKGYYDLVITDVQMPDMDGFKLLEIIGLEMDLPVIMLSINSETSYVMKGVLHGAVDYLVKPVRIEDLKLIWKHVIKKAVSDKKGSNDPIGNNNDIKAHNDECLRISNKCTNEVNKGDRVHETSDGEIAKHKKRVTWSTDLHLRFIAAVKTLGFDRAAPKKILEFMNVEGLTRENVASHLQKYRKTLKKNGVGLNQHHDGCHLNSLSVDSSSSVFSSFNQQVHAKKSSCKKFRLSEYQEDEMIASSDPPHASYGSSVSSLYQQFSSHSQAKLSTKYLSYPSDFSSPELTDRSPRFDDFSYQSLTSTSDPVDSYVNICPTTNTTTANQYLNSYSQFQCPSNQFSAWTSLYNNIELNDSAHLNTELFLT